MLLAINKLIIQLLFLVPSEPLDLKLFGAADGEATLRWKDPAHKNGKILNFVLRYYSSPDGEEHVLDVHKNANEVKVMYH